MASSRKLLSIGVFATLSRFSVKTLRRYQELGLLEPRWVDPDSGYRYYSPSQQEDALWIRRLRAADIPLATIKALLINDDEETRTAILSEHHKDLDTRAQQLLRARRAAYQLTQRDAISIDAVTVPAALALVFREQVNSSALGMQIPRAFGELYGALRGVGGTATGAPFSIHEVINTEDGRYLSGGNAADVPLTLAVPLAEAIEVRHPLMTVEQLRACHALRSHYHGDPLGIGTIHEHIAHEVQRRGAQPAGPPREVYHQTSYHTSDPQRWHTEVVWPIIGRTT